MSGKVSYQQIREQLINLNVDLEDKSKVCKILEQKVREEKRLLGLLEEEYETKYQSIIEVILLLKTEKHLILKDYYLLKYLQKES